MFLGASAVDAKFFIEIEDMSSKKRTYDHPILQLINCPTVDITTNKEAQRAGQQLSTPGKACRL